MHLDTKQLKRNSGAKEGDVIILSKPLGVGILSAALKKDQLSSAGYQKMIAYTTQLNKPGAILAKMLQVHALTDVTGFGLAGHLLEMSRGAGLQAQLDWQAIPLISEAVDFVKKAYINFLKTLGVTPRTQQEKQYCKGGR